MPAVRTPWLHDAGTRRGRANLRGRNSTTDCCISARGAHPGRRHVRWATTYPLKGAMNRNWSTTTPSPCAPPSFDLKRSKDRRSNSSPSRRDLAEKYSEKRNRRRKEANQGTKSKFLANMSTSLRPRRSRPSWIFRVMESGHVWNARFGKYQEYCHDTKKISQGPHLLEGINDILDMSKIEAAG